jgi:predicted MFS family arabinose efflux permease
MKESDIKDAEPPQKQVKLNKCFRIVLFFVLISVEMSMNWSSGVLSASSKEIKLQLNMNNKEFGAFGASNGAGRMIGCFLFTILVNNFNRKWVFASFTLVKGVLLFSFKLTNIGWLLVICRGIIGFVHMPPSIYIPVWIDQYGLNRYKTIFMTLLQVVIPGGKVQGYLLVLLFGEKNWQNGLRKTWKQMLRIGIICII